MAGVITCKVYDEGRGPVTPISTKFGTAPTFRKLSADRSERPLTFSIQETRFSTFRSGRKDRL